MECYVASVDGCEDQTEAVDAWAIRAAAEAEAVGWISALTEHIFCPKHRAGSEVAPNPSFKRDTLKRAL